MTITKVSIDFGNTNTIIAYEHDDGSHEIFNHPAIGRIDALLSSTDEPEIVSTIPSEVYITDESIKIGKQAYKCLEEDKTTESFENYHQNFKRDLLTSFHDKSFIHNDVKNEIAAANHFVSTLCAYLRKDLCSNNGEVFGEIEIIATVPVSAPMEYINWLRTALLNSELSEHIELIDEATAAALYFDDLEQGQSILMFDVGGATTDISLVEIQADRHTNCPKSVLLARYGIRAGGNDIDNVIANHIFTINELNGIDTYVPKVKKRAIQLAEAAKKSLTLNKKFTESYYDPDLRTDIGFRLTQEIVAEILLESKFLSRLSTFINDSISDLRSTSGVEPSSISKVLFIGGTTLQPSVVGLLRDCLASSNLNCNSSIEKLGQEVFSSVALGALKSTKYHIEGKKLFADICLEFDDGYRPVFRKGSCYPASSGVFLLGVKKPGQKYLMFRIAERNYMTSLGSSAEYKPITCNGEEYRMQVPKDTQAGDTRFATRFHIDDDLMIFANISDTHTGNVLFPRVEIGNKNLVGLLPDNELDSTKEQIPASPMVPLFVNQRSSTELLYSQTTNDFEREVQEEIISWSLDGWLLSGVMIPGHKNFTPDHVLILASGYTHIFEDKDYRGKWTGSENGPWKCDGKFIDCGKDENPIKQARKYNSGVKSRIQTIDPFLADNGWLITTVVAPECADLLGLNLEKPSKVKNQNELYDLVVWGDKNHSKTYMHDLNKKLPDLSKNSISRAFGLA